MTECRWCYKNGGKTVLQYELEFSVFDDDFGQFVPSTLIKFCPFCGRRIYTTRKEEKEVRND